jgi:glutathione S-transferase
VAVQTPTGLRASPPTAYCAPGTPPGQPAILDEIQTMKLYYSPGACSLSPHIVLHESGLPFQAICAPTKTKKLPDGGDYLAINPRGYVPLLELDDGQRMTEGPAIVQYIADQVPARQLAPANGTMARYRLQEWLTFIGTELHKGGFTPLFSPAANDEFKAATRERLAGRAAMRSRKASRLAYGDRSTAIGLHQLVTTNR